MDQGFKLRYDQMRESNPTGSEALSGSVEVQQYQQSGYARNICFAWPGGRRMFFNYAYLVAAEFDPGHETNMVKLFFSSHTVLVKGYSLDSLFMALLDHFPRLVKATDLRYVLAEDKTEAVVIEIHVEKKEV
ncbi:hypothetical protein GO755_30780 [Spirosoma sp. HMF4905]|uniref:Uncharacterized protein n=1 Tax=Spirosoma arboris TaxID=2682092 RepID=A0A7K1SLK1_9BACT|nr:hypothetical protein [Spirosoma arboris]MVM34456.1 hypothetical protein [Spirosoma arboris]